MQIYYDTKTGNVQRFIDKLKIHRDWRMEKIEEGMDIREPGHLVTFTTRFGDVPDTTISFLKNNAHYIYSVSSSGNRNWGKNFALAADKISGMFNIPVMLKFELSGTSTDVHAFIRQLEDSQQLILA